MTLILTGINFQIGQNAKFCGYKFLWFCEKKAKPRKINPMKTSIQKAFLFSFNQILHLLPSFGEYTLVAMSIVNNVAAIYCTLIL